MILLNFDGLGRVGTVSGGLAMVTDGSDGMENFITKLYLSSGFGVTVKL